MVCDNTFSDCLTVSMFQPAAAFGHVEERVVNLVRRGALAERQDPTGPQRLGAPRLDLEHLLTEDGVGLDRQTALRADRLASGRELHHDVVAVDLDALDLADVHAGDTHLVALVQLPGVGELSEVIGLGEQLRDAGKGLADGHSQHGHDEAHQADALPVGGFQRPHYGVHLPVGCAQTLTVRTGPPACNPLLGLQCEVTKVEGQPVP